MIGVRPDGTVNDIAVMAYREAYGGEVQTKRFLRQYHGKSAADGLRSPADMENIAGATLSVEATSRAVKKALAVAPRRLWCRGACMTRWVSLLIGMASIAHVAAAQPVTEVHYVMGTYFRITAEHPMRTTPAPCSDNASHRHTRRGRARSRVSTRTASCHRSMRRLATFLR